MRTSSRVDEREGHDLASIAIEGPERDLVAQRGVAASRSELDDGDGDRGGRVVVERAHINACLAAKSRVEALLADISGDGTASGREVGGDAKSDNLAKRIGQGLMRGYRQTCCEPCR